MEVKFPSEIKGVRFTSEWKAFHKEKDIKLEEVLLFTLRALARVRVGLYRWLKMVGRRSKELENSASGVTSIKLHTLKTFFSKYSSKDEYKQHPTYFYSYFGGCSWTHCIM